MLHDGFFEIAGLLGVMAYIFTYASLQSGMISGNGFLYPILNGAAASLVLVSLTNDFNLSSSIIQISWILISTFGILRLLYFQNVLRFSAAEKEFLTTKFPNLPNGAAKRLFALGQWRDFEKGHCLTVNEEPNSMLYYLQTGIVEVKCNGKVFATCMPGDFVGEMSCFTNSPAKGTAIVASPVRVFAIHGEKLNKIAPEGSPLRAAFNKAIANDLGNKLARNNLPDDVKENFDWSSALSGVRA